MFIRNLLLSTLAVAGIAHAQSSKACSADSNKVESQADLDKISGCNTLEGDLVIGEDLTTVDLPQLQQIKGGFFVENASDLTAINMGSLRSISKEFRLNSLIKLNSVNCPQLTSVGSINFVKLPELRSLTFTRKITDADSVQISDTRLESLDGIDLRTATRFRVDNCKSLKSVKVGLTNVSDELALEFNGRGLSIEFPELTWASNITVRDATKITLPKLVHINGTINFAENLFEKVECKKLKQVEQTIAFIGNNELTDIDFPELTEVGGALKLANNTALEVVDGFPKLKTIGGAIDFSGVFTNVTLQELEDVRGGFHLETKNEMDCSAFEEMNGNVIQGDNFTCKTKIANPESKDGSISTGGDGDDNSSGEDSDNNTGAAGRMTVGPILGLSLAAVFVAAF